MGELHYNYIAEKNMDILFGAISNIGKDPNGGFTRLAYSPVENNIHSFAAGYMKHSANLKIFIDPFLNLIGSLNPDAEGKRVMLMTHLDSVPNGGNYDGIVGLVSAVEALKIAGPILDYGVDLVCFRGEESSRFGRACIGSSAMFGQLSKDDLKKLHYEDNGRTITLEDAIRVNGGQPDQGYSSGLDPDHYFGLEIHIEQSTVLENTGNPLGIVTSIRAPERRYIHLSGKNAAKSFAQMVSSVELIASRESENGNDIVGTVGYVDNFVGVKPNSMNVIPGEVSFEFDGLGSGYEGIFDELCEKRGVDYVINENKGIHTITIKGKPDHSGGTPMGLENRTDALAAACELLTDVCPDYSGNITFAVDLRSNNIKTRDMISFNMVRSFKQIASSNDTSLVVDEATEYSTPQQMDGMLMDLLSKSASYHGFDHISLPSGAGHDTLKAAAAGMRCAMLFVPSIGGISHNSEEKTNHLDIVYATRTLAHALYSLNWHMRSQ